jgi:hypothetical protein
VTFEANASLADMGRVWLDFYPDRVDVRCSTAGSMGLVHTTLVSLPGMAGGGRAAGAGHRQTVRAAAEEADHCSCCRPAVGWQ